jgi:relaxase-like protein
MTGLADALIGELKLTRRKFGRPDVAGQDGGKKGPGGQNPSSQKWRSLSGSQSAFLKKIGNGGTHHPKQLAGQLAYVDGKAKALFGNGFVYEEGATALGDEQVSDLIENWSDEWKGSPKNGHTTHMVMSFPGHVTDRQATNIAREWAEEMFESRAHAEDEWEYYAALHTDTGHPHVHFIINNRGVDEGQWFYMAQGHAFNYETMRERIAGIAEEQGVYLDYTSRLERGIIEYAPTSAQYLAAHERGEVAEGRARTGDALAAAKAEMLAHAKEYRALANLADVLDFDDMAAMAKEAADQVGQFQQVARLEPGGGVPEPANLDDIMLHWAEHNGLIYNQLSPANREAALVKIVAKIDALENMIGQGAVLNDPDFEQPAQTAKRVSGIESQTAIRPATSHAYGQPFLQAVVQNIDRIKDRAVQFMPDGDAQERMDGFVDLKLGGWIVAIGASTKEHRTEAQAFQKAYNDYSKGQGTTTRELVETLIQRAEHLGIDPDTFTHRLITGAANAREDQAWIKSDVDAFLKKGNYDNTHSGHIKHGFKIINGFQEFARETLEAIWDQQVMIDIGQFEDASRVIIEQMHAYQTATFDTITDAKDYLDAFKAVYGANDIESLAKGKISVLENITDKPQAQRDLAYAVFKLADGFNDADIGREQRAAALRSYNPQIWYGRGGFSI